MLRMHDGIWGRLSSEIGKRILAETAGVAFATLRHVDNALSNRCARPVCREL